MSTSTGGLCAPSMRAMAGCRRRRSRSARRGSRRRTWTSRRGTAPADSLRFVGPSSGERGQSGDCPGTVPGLSPVMLVEQANDAESEAAHYAVSDSGTLVYVPGNAAIFQRKLLWVSQNGAIEPINAPAGAYTDPSI